MSIYTPMGVAFSFLKLERPEREEMSCGVATTNSSLFSPSAISSSTLCKSSSASSDSPRVLNLHNVYDYELSPSPLLSTSSSSSMALRRRKQMREAPSSIYSRKRPAKLSIPIVSVDFGGECISIGEGVDLVEVEEEGYSVYCKKGRRGLRGNVMEDRYSAIVNRYEDSRQASSFFGVFDGHGGSKAAEFAAKEMGKNILDRTARSQKNIEEVIKECYLITDEQFSEECGIGGTCCVSALIRNGNLAVSNAGDCRAVLSRNGTAEALSSDHRPSRDDERTRIQNLGGYVDCRNGVWRVQGSLAVSRAIGDRHLKQWVISEPETSVTKISHDCEFLILASDGLWDKVSNEEAVDLVRPFCVGVEEPKLLFACKKMAELSMARGSTDDISVMIVNLGCFV